MKEPGNEVGNSLEELPIPTSVWRVKPYIPTFKKYIPQPFEEKFISEVVRISSIIIVQ